MFESVLTFIFFFVVSVWLLSKIGGWLLRRWVLKKQREMEAQFGGAAGSGHGRSRGVGTRNKRAEGEVSVEHTSPVEKRVNKSVGDYVDFEEVEETVTEETTIEE